jgi:hypothetical protein
VLGVCFALMERILIREAQEDVVAEILNLYLEAGVESGSRRKLKDGSCVRDVISSCLRVLTSLNACGQELFRSLEFSTARGRQVAPGAIDEKCQHAHAGAWPFRRNFLGSQASRDGGSVLIEQTCWWVGRVCLYLRGPAMWIFAFRCT